MQEALDKKNITFNGKKAQVIEKVKEHLNEDEIKAHFTGLYYKRKLNGEQITLDNRNLNDFHKSYYRFANKLKIEEFYLLSKRFKNLDAKDVCKKMVEKKKQEEISDFDWDQFFENEIKPGKPIDHFIEILNKYPTQETVEIEEVTDEDFLQVVFRKENEEEPYIPQIKDGDETTEQSVKKIKPLAPLFVKCFIFSSVLSVAIVYYLYHFIYQ